MDPAVRTISSFFALSAFGISIVAGIVARNPASAILTNALISMILCRVIGTLVGGIAVRWARAEIDAYHQANPIPNPNMPAGPELAELGEAAPLSEQSTKSSQST